MCFFLFYILIIHFTSRSFSVTITITCSVFCVLLHSTFRSHVCCLCVCRNSDINREVKNQNLFIRTNMLRRRFKRCSRLVNVRHFPIIFVHFVFVCTTLQYGLTIQSVLLTGLNRVTLSLKSFFAYPKSWVCLWSWRFPVSIL